ncbi:Cytochrome c5 [Legionella massiliensis]|uniref:Cytochrome c5 n=1 Tax=Legionella massiliensis TaxID=1034943 RepID=A0A078KW79_9GAMM|nr:c-type cytochrome [Legionella massiliensis]CDZ77262.1 Cytochrome c5 [Legionella massiliensis]CEE13000.1 hypothetical protein BN1094_01544 [Legionella massiliensis]
MKTILFILFIAFNGTLLASNLGKQTYEMACKTCHDSQVAKGMHAPAAFNNKAWAKRFKKAAIESINHPSKYKTAMDYLLYSASIGKGLMPHGGLCKEAVMYHKNCSTQALADAINYMSGN